MTHYRRLLLATVLALTSGLSTMSQAEDDMDEQPQAGMAQSPSMAPDTAPPHSTAHGASENPLAMAAHMEQMAAAMHEQGQNMETLGRQLQAQSVAMHQQAMSLKAQGSTPQGTMDVPAALQHMNNMSKAMDITTMQMQNIDTTMQQLNSGMGGGGMGQNKMGHM